MKALKAALEELNVIDPFDALATDIGSLGELAQYAEDNSGGVAGVSMESIFQSFKEKDYLVTGTAVKYHFATEEMSAGIWAVIVAAAVAIIALLKKFYDWAFGGSGGGHMTSSISFVAANRSVVKEQAGKIKEMDSALGDGNATVDPSKSTSNTSPKRITTLDGVIDLYPKESQEQTPAFQFLHSRNGILEDILTQGQFTKTMHAFANASTSGIYSPEKVAALEKEFAALMDKGSTDVDALNKFSTHLDTYQAVSFPGLTVGEGETPLDALRKLHTDLANKEVKTTYTVSQVHDHLSKAIDDINIGYIEDGVKHMEHGVKAMNEQYEKIRIEAQVTGHKVTAEERAGTVTEAGRVMNGIMKKMTMISKTTCEIIRAMYIMTKGILTVCKYMQTLGRLAILILSRDVMPKIKDEAAKERVKTLAATLKENYAAYKV